MYQLTPEDVNQITESEMAFGSTKLLPDFKDIPVEFDAFNGTSKYTKLVSDWFFNGLEEFEPVMNDGFDKDKCIVCLGAHLSSYSPKHEHKTAGVAYMMSFMFKDVKWKAQGK